MLEPSHARKSLEFCSLFESEVLVRLMLLHWEHPKAADDGYCLDLLNSANELLAAADAARHESNYIENMGNGDMNLVAAIW